MIRLFDLEDGKVIPSPEARMLDAFHVILDRDKDKNKINALKELAYIYWTCDYRSSYMVYPEDVRENKVIVDVFGTKRWNPDTLIKAAQVKYKELQETATIKMLAQVKESLATTSDLIKLIKERISDRINVLTLLGDYMELEAEERQESDEILTRAVSDLNKIIKLSSDLPPLLTSIDMMENKVKQEQASGIKTRGGGSINDFER